MGNRAIIQTRDSYENNGIGIYLHWNGGRDSVNAFLTYCKLRGFRPPEWDGYGWARPAQVIGNFFGGDLSVSIDNFNKDEGKYTDNGTYIIEDWEIVGRKYYDYEEQDSYDLKDFLERLDSVQPERDRLGADKISNYIRNMEV